MPWPLFLQAQRPWKEGGTGEARLCVRHPCTAAKTRTARRRRASRLRINVSLRNDRPGRSWIKRLLVPHVHPSRGAAISPASTSGGARKAVLHPRLLTTRPLASGNGRTGMLPVYPAACDAPGRGRRSPRVLAAPLTAACASSPPQPHTPTETPDPDPPCSSGCGSGPAGLGTSGAGHRAVCPSAACPHHLPGRHT